MKKALLLGTLIWFGITGFGQQWDSIGPLGFTSVSAGQPQIITDQLGVPIVQYYNASGGEVYVESWNGSTWQSIGAGAVTAAISPPIQSAEIAVDNSNNLYLAYKNGAVDGWKCGVKMWNGSAWIQFGSDNFSPGQTSFLDIAISSTNEVYVLIADQFYQLSVMKHNGTDWVSVGSTYFTPSQAYGSSLALDNFDTPFVCFADSTQNQQLSLMKFNGTNWIYEGSPSITNAPSGNCDLIFDSNNYPVVGYRNNNNNRLYVTSNQGSSWAYLGPGAISTGATNQPNLGIDSGGKLYVTARDDGANSNALLWDFDGTNWNLVGGNNLSTGLGDQPTLAFDLNDVPHVTYRDNDQSGKATAMKYCATEANMNITTCQTSYTSPSGNDTYYSTGVYKDTIQNFEGCDSVLNINLTMNTSNISAFTWFPNLCLGDSTPAFVSMNGSPTFTWSDGLGTGDSVMINTTVSDTFTVVGDDGAGCVDTAEVIINVVTPPAIVTTLSDSLICVNDSVNIQVSGNAINHWMTPSFPTSGTFPTDFWIQFIGPGPVIIGGFDSTSSCESVDTLDILVAFPPSISGGQTGNIMWVNDNGYTYEWYLNSTIISGADSSNYTATQNGDYTVHVYDSLGCFATLSWTVNGLSIIEETASFSIYPNPFKDNFTISGNGFTQIELMDMSGQLVLQTQLSSSQNIIDTEGVQAGSYIIVLHAHDKTYKKLLIKQ